jgi:AraC-like DNA-binding protein
MIFSQLAATLPVNIVTVLLAIFTYSIGYFTLLRPEVFQVSLKRHKKQGTSIIDQSETDILVEKITHVLGSKKIYLNQKLTVKGLALELNSTPKIISQIINSSFKKSFYDLVNSYRIEDVKRSLKDEQYKHLTIEGIALNSGFNSSSTFNRLFKSYTGRTPREYRSL